MGVNRLAQNLPAGSTNNLFDTACCDRTILFARQESKLLLRSLVVQPKDIEKYNQGLGQSLRYRDRVLDFVLGHVWLYDYVPDRFAVKIEVRNTQGHELTDSKPCLKHKQGHAVVADRLAHFIGSAGVVSKIVKKIIGVCGFKGGR